MVPKTPHVYTHSRILQIIPASPPAWVVYRLDAAEESIDASPVLCWALVEKWESYEWRDCVSPSRQDRHNSCRVICPVTVDGDTVDVDDSNNILFISTEWPLPADRHRQVLASLEPREPHS